MKNLILITLFSVFISGTAFAQDVNLDKFLEQTQMTNSAANEINLVWWIPVEFWQVALSEDGSMSKSELEEYMRVLSPYFIVAIADGKVGAFGGITYTDSESIGKTVKVSNSKAKEIKPVKPSTLNPDIQNLLAALKPVIKNMLGQLGENINFYVFEDFIGKERFASPLIQDFLVIEYLKKEFVFETPVSALLPQKKCPECKKMLDGSWKFCPWDGEELLDK